MRLMLRYHSRKPLSREGLSILARGGSYTLTLSRSGVSIARMNRRVPTPAAIGRRLRLARERAQIKQDEACARLKPPRERNVMTSWEAGRTLPNAHQLAQLAAMYSESPLYLLGFDVQPAVKLDPDSERAKEIAQLADKIHQLALRAEGPDPDGIDSAGKS